MNRLAPRSAWRWLAGIAVLVVASAALRVADRPADAVPWLWDRGGALALVHVLVVFTLGRAGVLALATIAFVALGWPWAARQVRGALALAVAGALGAVAWRRLPALWHGARAAALPRSVVVVVVDGLRVDRVASGIMPTLARAPRAVVRTASGSRDAAFRSLVTGLSPEEHGVRRDGERPVARLEGVHPLATCEPAALLADTDDLPAADLGFAAAHSLPADEPFGAAVVDALARFRVVVVALSRPARDLAPRGATLREHADPAYRGRFTFSAPAAERASSPGDPATDARIAALHDAAMADVDADVAELVDSLARAGRAASTSVLVTSLRGDADADRRGDPIDATRLVPLARVVPGDALPPDLAPGAPRALAEVVRESLRAPSAGCGRQRTGDDAVALTELPGAGPDAAPFWFGRVADDGRARFLWAPSHAHPLPPRDAAPGPARDAVLASLARELRRTLARRSRFGAAPSAARAPGSGDAWTMFTIEGDDAGAARAFAATLGARIELSSVLPEATDAAATDATLLTGASAATLGIALPSAEQRVSARFPARAWPPATGIAPVIHASAGDAVALAGTRVADDAAVIVDAAPADPARPHHVFLRARAGDSARTIDAPLSALNVAPTLAELRGEARPPLAEGRSIAASVRDPSRTIEPALRLVEAPDARSLETSSLRYVERDAPRSHRLCAFVPDPGCAHDLSRERPDDLVSLRDALAAALVSARTQAALGSDALAGSRVVPRDEPAPGMPRVSVRFASGGGVVRVAGSLAIRGYPGVRARTRVVPVGVDAAALRESDDADGARVIDAGLATAPGALVGFDVVIDPPVCAVTFALTRDGVPWPRERLFLGALGLASDAPPARSAGFGELDVALGDRPPPLDPARDDGAFVAVDDSAVVVVVP